MLSSTDFMEIFKDYWWYHLPSSVKEIIYPSSVTNIDSYAFENCSNLITITFPDDSKLRLIGKGAFKSISIKEIIIPSSVTNIGNNAFLDCSNLTSITFQHDSKFQSIRLEAFRNAFIIESIIPSSVTNIGNVVFF